jgi:hypothetical protein
LGGVGSGEAAQAVDAAFAAVYGTVVRAAVEGVRSQMVGAGPAGSSEPGEIFVACRAQLRYQVKRLVLARAVPLGLECSSCPPTAP